ncbi:MAG: hypothetical protein A2075_23910 [Geobacteraceae bacterium GWC2_58_44]|nr:MAG: hypothetical protein A2075_23910 [Geobacteraceae bacterium GWC2_58_44]
MNKYSEYFEIDEGYWPEINPSSIKDPLNKWQKTFPHKTFIDLLKATERMLARGTNSDKKGTWIEGAYGTGKSRVAWALKNLLDCSDDEFKAYFMEYDALKKEPDLRDKLLGHKQGKIITAYRYASGGIDGDRSLIMAVYESVTKALRSAGITYKGENTLRGGVAAWLSDGANKAFFDTLIALPEYRGLGSFAGKSADDIIGLLNTSNADVDTLMGDIFSLADSRGITALSTSMDDLIAWLTDVIDQNKLKAIVLVWDEFSAYFKKNRTSLDEFQKLAELSNDKPFYLMIVTHMSGSIFGETDQTGKIVRDRFVRKEIELPDSIAFELINYALTVKGAQKDIWDSLADDLNSRMTFSRKAVREAVWNGSNAGDEVLKGMLPIHPLAALLLKNISSAFASNQRSMFNFIKNAETENLQAFQWFIDNHSPDNADFLTIDLLWNFFYEKGVDEYGNGTGRSNLEFIIRTILDTFQKNEGRLLADEKRVLKTVLMMQAISQKLGNSVELFLTTEKNIKLAFEGTDLEENRSVNLVKKLVRDGILYAKPMGGEETQYAAAAVSGDQAQIDSIKKRIVSDTKTVSLVSGGDLLSALSLSPALRFRYDVTPVTVENFTATINKITNELSTYKFRAVLSFARDDEEQNKIRELIKGAMKDDRYKDLVFVDASSTVLGGERFGQWVDCAANDEYWRTKDGKLAEEMARKAKAILEDWKTDVANGSFTVYSAYAKTGEPYGSAFYVLTALSNAVIRKYPLSFDNAKLTENWFKTSAFNDGAKRGINQICGGVFQEKETLVLMQNAWHVVRYWETTPTLPLAKLKQKVDDCIKTTFERDGRISVGDVFDALMEQGFMPCNLYALLTGFLLKEYAADIYRYSDGDTGDKMSAEKLAEIVGEYIKHMNTPIARYKEKFIEVMTQEQMAFVGFAKIVFGIPDNIAVEQAAVRIRSRLKELCYPIWCFKEIDTYGLEDFIDKLTVLANPNNTGDSVAKIAAAIGKMSLQTPTAAGNLASLLFTKENPVKAMTEFLLSFENGDVLNLANKINAHDVLLDVKRQFGTGEALWLWDRETGENEIRKLLTDYKIVAASNRINTKTSSLYDCLGEWREKAKSIRIPCSALVMEVPALKAFFLTLREIALHGELPYDKRGTFLSELEINANPCIDFFESKMEIFRNLYSFYLTGFSDSEVNALHSKLPVASFTSDKPDFEKNLAELADKIQREQEKFRLHQLWEKTTSSKTPKEWSNKNRTPILALVTAGFQSDARRVFGIINRINPEDSEVKFALDFLQTKATFLGDLSDKVRIDAAFMRDIVGRFIAVLSDADEVRSHLEKIVPADHYDWYGNPAITREVEKFAQARYNQGGSEKVLEKIEKIDDRKAKEYLKRLIKDNMYVGIEIILEG